MHESLRTIDDLLATAADEQSCWTTLLAVRQLERMHLTQIRLLAEYQKHYSSTHWTIKIVVKLALEQLHDTGVRTRLIINNLYRQLQSHEATLSIQLQRQLRALRTETQSMLDIEQEVLYRMLDMLILAPQRPVSRSALRVIK